MGMKTEKGQSPSKTVLVIDDEADICEALELALSMEGYVVKAAQRREAAFSLAKKVNPAVILLDYNMPDFNVRDFAAWLKAENVRTPIVLMSGVSDAPAKAKDLGFAHVLSKPFDLDVLLDLLRKIAV
jgi:DNA-binding response OmpR family regulator